MKGRLSFPFPLDIWQPGASLPLLDNTTGHVIYIACFSSSNMHPIASRSFPFSRFAKQSLIILFLIYKKHGQWSDCWASPSEAAHFKVSKERTTIIRYFGCPKKAFCCLCWRFSETVRCSIVISETTSVSEVIVHGRRRIRVQTYPCDEEDFVAIASYLRSHI